MLTKPGYITRKLRSKAFKLFMKLENLGNAHFKSNGEEFFLNSLFQFFRMHVKGKIVLFDVGANIGEYTDILLARCKVSVDRYAIHLFEPTRPCFEELEKKFSSIDDVTLNQFALSSSEGSGTIYYDEDRSGFASLHKRNLSHYSIELGKKETISTMRLDRYIEDKVIDHIHFIKLDIEGHELAALEGMGNYLDSAFCDFIQFEYGGANLDSRTSLLDLYSLLTGKGFILAKMMPRGLELRQYAPSMENFHYSNYVAISEPLIDVMR